MEGAGIPLPPHLLARKRSKRCSPTIWRLE
nr:MAG TPA: hypothetical protein [Caudoviricetes sp.]DAO58627.1 MAG TPA: hypothetical protein [Caudoviricetes sp.]